MAEYPAELTPALRQVLGTLIFSTGPMAHTLRDGLGLEIPKQIEDEQAHVLHWLIGLVLNHPDDWQRIREETLLAAELKAIEKEEERLWTPAR